ncbi:MAG TPA: hypothetical protein VGK59_01640 [Ohtaekwangia sp.]
MNKILIPLLLVLFACGTKDKNDAAATDSDWMAKEKAREDSIQTAARTTETTPVSEVTNWSAPVLDAKDADSLFNILVRMQVMKGEFGYVDLITDKVLNATDPNDPRKLLGVLIVTGEGESYNTQFATQYFTLAVFEQGNGQVKLIDFADLGTSSSYGLQVSDMEADSLMLADNRFAMVLHSQHSEEGAGDSGYRRDAAQYYVLLNDKLTSIFERTLDDFSFASNESDYYRETTITTTITVLPEKSNGLFNLEVSTEGDRREISEEEDENNDPDVTEQKEGDGLFRWNGKAYEKVNP